MVQTMTEGFKHTEVGVIPSDWEVKALGEIVDFLDGRRRPIKDSDRSKMKGVYPYYGASGIIDYINDYLFDEPLILLGEDGENILSRNLRLAFKVSGKIWVNNHAHVIRPKQNYDLDYLAEKLESINYEQYNSGTAQPKLNQKTCRIIPIPLPTLAEQTAIATALNDADALIQKLEQLIAKKRHLKTGAMQELLRPKEGWEVKTLGEIADVVGGGTPSTFNTSYWNGNINWFTPTEIGDKKYSFESARKITIDGLKNSSAKLLPVGTILLTSRASIGDASILKVESCTNQGFQSLIIKENNSNEFLYYLILTLKQIMLQNASGSTFLEISPSKLKSIEISVPTPAEQTRIARILSDMDNEIQALEAQLEQYKRVKQGMMQALLTGKIRLV